MSSDLNQSLAPQTINLDIGSTETFQQDSSNAPIVFNYNPNTGNFDSDSFMPESVEGRISKEEVRRMLRKFQKVLKRDRPISRLTWFLKLFIVLSALIVMPSFVSPFLWRDLTRKIMSVGIFFLFVYAIVYCAIASRIMSNSLKDALKKIRKFKEYEASQTNGLRWKVRFIQTEVDRQVLIELHKDYLGN